MEPLCHRSLSSDMPPANDQDYEGWPIPKLRLEVRDMDSPGARKFFGSVNAATALKDAVRDVFVWLYTRESAPKRSALLPSEVP